jgi:Ca2+-transporting ATPase
VLLIYTPFLQQAFDTVPLSLLDWLFCVAVASSVLWLRELSKLLSRGRTASGGKQAAGVAPDAGR